MSDKRDTQHEQGLRRFKFASEAWKQQRVREREDLQFQVPEMQWTEAAKAQRNGGSSSTTPGRPMLSVSLLDQPLKLVQNQERAAHLGINIHPLTPDADDDTAEIQQGLIRHIERDSNGRLARSWAYDRASQAGFGAYYIETCWDDDSDNPADQKLVIRRILDAADVLLDPSAKEPDFCDGEFAFLRCWLSQDTFKAQFKGAQIPTPASVEGLGADMYTPDWVTAGSGMDNGVLVVNYWYKVHSTEDVEYQDAEGKTVSRPKDVVKVMLRKMTALGFVTEEEDTEGKYIPLVPVIGTEQQPFDQQRRLVGIVGPAKDGQRVYNYAISQVVESVALEPKAPFIGTAEQFEGHEPEWDQVNNRNFPYVRYTPHNFEGNLVPPPARIQVDTAKMSLAMQLAQSAQGFVQTSSKYYNESLGNGNKQDRSGRAIQELQDQSEEANSHYLANLADISMNLEARILLDLLPRKYDRPGRIVRILGIEDESEAVMLNKPFYSPGKGQNPVAADEGQVPEGKEVKHYDLNKGAYGVSISIGKSYQSRLEQGASEMGEILQARPELMPMIGWLYMKYRDFPGAPEMSDMLKKWRDHDFPYMASDGEDDQSPEALSAKVQQLTQQTQQMGQQLQQAGQAIATDQAKQQATLAKAQQDNATKVQLAQMQAQIDILIEAMKQKGETERATLKVASQESSDKFNAAHEVALESHKQGHAIESAAMPGIKPLDLSFAGEPGADLGQDKPY